MKEHKGMRPQDIVILLKIISLGEQNWYKKDLAGQLSISNSEISESLNRSAISGLIEDDKETVCKEPLLEFLVYGVTYAFPTVRGSLIRGMPTAFSAPILSDEFVVDDPYVWPASGYTTKGIEITPLYRTVPKASTDDPLLYEMLALTDALRIRGKKHEVITLLSEKIYGSE